MKNSHIIWLRVLYYDSPGGACRALAFALAKLSRTTLLQPNIIISLGLLSVFQTCAKKHLKQQPQDAHISPIAVDTSLSDNGKRHTLLKNIAAVSLVEGLY